MLFLYKNITDNRIIGIGCDIVSIDRIMKIHLRSSIFARKILSDTEFNIMQSKSNLIQQGRYLAKRWCCKEAIFKAIPNAKNFVRNAKYMEITNDNIGKPNVKILDTLHKMLIHQYGEYDVHISITDELHTAMAFCVIQNKKNHVIT